MPRQKPFSKKTATTFALVHRAQNDPLIHDENAPSMVFAEKQSSQPHRPTEDDYAYSDTASIISGDSAYRSKKTKQRGDLEDEFGRGVRENEGEAAEQGVFFDDSEYDYMQHLRDLGGGEGGVTWVEASAPQEQHGKGKGKLKLEDALRTMDLASDAMSADAQSVGTHHSSTAARSLLPEEVLPSEFVRRRDYQDQQDVPDALAGLQPDMDPRLREVLEALEDEAFVDDEEMLFAELVRDGPVEVERGEWELLGEQQMFEDGDEDEDGGWESDDTVRAISLPTPTTHTTEHDLAQPPEDPLSQPPPSDPTDGAWIDEFKKFKSATKAATTKTAIPPIPASTLDSSALSSLASGKRKKRKGAKTSTTNYSMTSSALARTDQQTLLDSRFDKIEENYAVEEELAEDEGSAHFNDDALSAASGASRTSRYSTASSGLSGISSYSRASDTSAPQLQRADFDSIMDGFLGGYSKAGRRVKRGAPQTGMQQLEEVRRGLGPARLKAKSAAAAGGVS